MPQNDESRQPRWWDTLPANSPYGPLLEMISKVPGQVTENIKQAPRKFAQKTDELDKIFEGIRSGKETDLGPLVQAGMEMSMPMAGKITRQVWKAMQPEARSMLRKVKEASPEIWQQIKDTPHDLMAFVRELQPGVYGQLATTKVSKNMAELMKKPELVDKPNKAVMQVIPEQTGKLDTLIHEIQHYLGFGRAQKTRPEDAGTIGALLQDLLRKGRQPSGSLNRRIGDWKDAMTQQPGDPTAVGKDIWQKLSPEQKAKHMSLAAPQYKPKWSESGPAGPAGYYRSGESILDGTQRAMMDEGLAHLAESTARPGTPQNLLDLAQKLGVGMKKPAQYAKRPIGAEIDVLSANAGVSQNQGLVDDVIKALTQGGSY